MSFIAVFSFLINVLNDTVVIDDIKYHVILLNSGFRLQIKMKGKHPYEVC